MADWNVTSPTEAIGLQFDRMAGQIRCAMPGVVVQFYPETQTADVQPAIKMKVNLGDGVKQVQLPVINNVPMVLPFAQSYGLLLTLPIKEGDECLLIFGDRSIDNFAQKGGVQPTVFTASEDTTTPRSHHLSDAICIPGIISNPQAVPDYNEKNIELRDRERKQYISLGTAPEGITITDGTAIWNMKGGKVTLNAPAGIEETSQGPIKQTTTAPQTIIGSNISIDGNNPAGGGVYEIDRTLKSRQGTFIDKDSVTLNTHVHTNVWSGPDNTGEPQK